MNKKQLNMLFKLIEEYKEKKEKFDALDTKIDEYEQNGVNVGPLMKREKYDEKVRSIVNLQSYIMKVFMKILLIDPAKMSCPYETVGFMTIRDTFFDSIVMATDSLQSMYEEIDNIHRSLEKR